MVTDEKKKKIAQTLFNTGGNAVKSSNFAYALDCYSKCAKLVPEMLLYRQSARGAARKLYKDNGKGAAGAAFRASGSWVSIKVAKTRKKWIDVMGSAEDVLALNPWDVDAMLEICNACKELNDMADVGLWVARSAAESVKDRKDVWLMITHFAIEQKVFNEAISALEQAKKVDPNDGSLSTRIREISAQSTIHTGGYEEEENEDGDGDENSSKSGTPKPTPVVKPATPPAESADQRGKRELVELEEKVAASPKTTMLYLQLGDAYRRANDIPKALQTFDRGYKECNKDSDLRARFLELRIDQLRNSIADAQNFAGGLDKNMPDYPEKSGKAQGHVKAALATILKAEIELNRLRLDFSPDDYAAALELGMKLHQIGEFDEAIKYLQKARGELRQKWKALMYLGLCFLEKKNFTLAEKNLADALPLVPAMDEKSRKEIFYHRGRVAEDAGNKEFAVQCYNEVAAIDYAYRDVASRLDRLTGGTDS